MEGKFVKIIGIAATIVGLGATLLTDWVNEQKMDERIEEKVNEILTPKDENDDEEF